MEPNPETMNESNIDISEVVLPRLAAVGGASGFVKYLKDNNFVQDVSYNSSDETKMLEQLQNQLTADGFPKNVIDMFNVFELETFTSTLQQFAREQEDIQHRNATGWLPLEKEYTLKLRPTISCSDLRNFGFDHLINKPKQVKTSGIIRWLPKLPRLDNGYGIVDLGTCSLIFLL